MINLCQQQQLTMRWCIELYVPRYVLLTLDSAGDAPTSVRHFAQWPFISYIYTVLHTDQREWYIQTIDNARLSDPWCSHCRYLGCLGTIKLGSPTPHTFGLPCDCDWLLNYDLRHRLHSLQLPDHSTNTRAIQVQPFAYIFTTLYRLLLKLVGLRFVML